MLTTSLTMREGFSPLLLRDGFDQSSGSLNGKALPIGATTWASTGDADDFTINATDHTARRTAASDTAGTFAVGGRYATAGASMAGAATAAIDFSHTGTLAAVSGVLLRYTDTNNWLRAIVVVNPSSVFFGLYVRVGGADAQQLAYRNYLYPLMAGAWYRVGIMVTDQGVVGARFGERGRAFDVEPLSLFAMHPALAPSGALASGKAGFYDTNFLAETTTRDYDNFAVWEPDVGATIFAGQNLELAHDGAARTAADGVGAGRIEPYGSHPRLPQGGPVEIMVAASRGDFDQVPDSGLDDVSVQVHHQPTWLTTPGS